MNTTPRTIVRGWLALALTGLLVGGGLVVGAAPASAESSPAVAVTTAPAAGGEVTVTGTGFDVAGDGVYVGLAPSGGAGFFQVAAQLVDTVWVASGNEDGLMGDRRTGALNADGSFSLTLTVPAATEEAPGYQVYTARAHSPRAPGVSQSTITTVPYAPEPEPEPEPEPAVPTVTVSKTTELDAGGELITVTGSGFLPDAPSTSGARPPLAGKFGGAYVVFGKFADTWKPSEAAPSSARKVGDQKYVVHAEDLATIGGAAAGGAVVAPDGTFSVELRVKKGFAGEPATGNYGVYTYPGSGAKYAAFETFTPVTFAASPTALTLTTSPSDQVVEGGLVTLRATLDSPVAGSVTFSTAGAALGTVATDASGVTELVVPSPAVGAHTLNAVFTPTDTATHAASSATVTLTVVAKPVATAGSLTWGFKQAFRSYLTGPIAHGSIITTGAGTSGGAFVFGQAGGGSFDGSTGTSVYSGSVRFLGHGGILDLSLSNPVVRVDSASSGVLLVRVNGGSLIPFATLSLGSGSKSVANGAVSYSGIPATLTAQGAAAFVHGGSQFYPAGTALDPVSFVIGSPRSIGAGTATVAAFIAPAAVIPPSPPATTGITIQTPLEQLAAGAEITITADGFQPNEGGIKVVIYSEPIVLATDVTADAKGTVTWTGALPAGLTGKHTLTLQGSVDRGVELTIAELMMRTTSMDGCLASDASLTWGFKEAFRSYVSGTIARGEWSVANGATYETPSFGWNSGTGTYDASSGEGLLAFEGSVQFTGHGGVLNTTISNPQLRFDGDGRATLLLDVTGDTRDGVAVDQRGVEFATIDLGAAEQSDSDGQLQFAEAPAVLTAAGSSAFGTYEAGSDLDPITVAFTTADGCAAPPAEAGDDGAAPVAEQDAGPGWLLWVAIAAVLAALAAASWIVIARRRKVA